MIPANINALLLGEEAGGAAAYAISRSLRFNSSDSAYLSRTPASAGNRKTWTWAGWVKRSKLADYQRFFWATGECSIRFENDDTLRFSNYTGTFTAFFKTTAVYRDVSAWYHIVLVADTTNATASDRIRLYVNGERVASFSSQTNPNQNLDLEINTANAHNIAGAGGSEYFSGYLADIHFIDGQALDPTSFTEVSATTGQLIPKAYTGSFGTNGFWLKFSDNSAATATTLGKDYSGNSNNWTPNNLSVTAGAGNDSLVDTPTSYGTDTGAGGEVRGNFATLSPITTSGQGLATLADGNLDISGTGSSYTGCVSTIAVSSGKWYWEYTVTAYGSASGTGLVSSASLSGAVGGSYGYAQVSDGWFRSGTTVTNNASNAVTGLSSVGTNDVINVAVDIDAGKLWFGRNGTWESSGNPPSGTNATVTFTPGGKSFYALAQGYGTWSGVLNAGARPFAYTAPSGFKALCDTNLPAPVVAKPSTVMDVVLWTGNGSARSITGLGFNPDLVWIKGRSGATDHALYDVVRGAEKRLESNTTDAEVTSDGGVTAFNSDGFSLGTLAQVNTNSATYAGWAWDAGSSTVTNTQGSITSSVRANASAGFSIVSLSAATGSYGHGLNVAPSFIISRARNRTTGWLIYHSSATTVNQYLAFDTNAVQSAPNLWGSITSTTIGMNLGVGFLSGDNVISYCFAPVAGYSSFGSYTGNGSADGPFVYTGFRPRWILYKESSASGSSWELIDAARNPYNASNARLFPDSSGSENTAQNALDILSNGFKPRASYGGNNSSGQTYIYAAFAESPFQHARAR